MGTRDRTTSYCRDRDTQMSHSLTRSRSTHFVINRVRTREREVLSFPMICYVMTGAVTEEIVTRSRRLVEFSVSKWLKLTQFHLFTPLFDWNKQLYNGETYKNYEKRAIRPVSTFVYFEIGSVYTITFGLPWKFLNFDGVLQRFPSITQANPRYVFNDCLNVWFK